MKLIIYIYIYKKNITHTSRIYLEKLSNSISSRDNPPCNTMKMYTANGDNQRAPFYHKMSGPPEYATLHHSRRAAGDAESSLLWGAFLGNAPLRRSVLEHGLLRGERSAVRFPITLTRTIIEQFEDELLSNKK